MDRLLKQKKVLMYFTTIVLVAAINSLFAVLENTKGYDIVLVLLYSKITVYFVQSLVFIFVFCQVLIYRSVRPLTGIRNKSDYIKRSLGLLGITEITIYFAINGVFFVLSGAPIIADGDVDKGLLLILLRYILLLVSGLVIVQGTYQFRWPLVWLVIVIIINLVYHFVLEREYLLKWYSPMYDPVYRAMHNIIRPI